MRFFHERLLEPFNFFCCSLHPVTFGRSYSAMLDPETNRNIVEWRQARPEDAAIWVSVTRRSADQMPLESEDSQIARYREEDAVQQAQRYLLWRDDTPIGRLRFYTHEDTAILDGLVLLPE